MDEPTVGIDPQSRNYILEAVKKLRENGTTILYTTHYMEEVQAIASSVTIMDQGQIIKKGTVEELIQTVQHEEKVRIDVTDPDSVPVNSLEKIAGGKEGYRSWKPNHHYFNIWIWQFRSNHHTCEGTCWSAWHSSR